MFRFAEIGNIVWLSSLPILVAIFIYGWFQKRKALERYAGITLLSGLMADVSIARQRLKVFLVFCSLIFLVLTLLRPQGNPVEKIIKKRGRDLVFVVDVSRSMLAEDLKPNRLGKARQLILEVVEILEGDRIGLLVFAGSTAIKCPLTLDYNYFKKVLDQIGPDDVTRGGTQMGDAIRMVSDRLFYDQDNKYRDIIFITDGEDHDSFPVEAAESAAKRGIRIHTVGLGDPDGANIPLRAEGTYSLMKYQEEVVKSRLDEKTLKKISEVTHGVFIPVRTNLADMAALYQKHISNYETRETEAKESRIWRELFQFFLGLAILLLMIESLIGLRSSRTNQMSRS